MKEIKLSKVEFLKLFREKCVPNLRVCLDEVGITPWDSEEERKRKIEEAFNPKLPRYIDMYTADGIVRYSIAKDD